MRKSGTQGFTLVELLMVIAVLAVLAAVAYTQYSAYLDNAQKMVSVSTMSGIRNQMEHYFTDYGKYPDNFDFSTCQDPDGHPILPAYVCSQVLTSVFALDSYMVTTNDYTMIARAKNRAHSVIKITKSEIIF